MARNRQHEMRQAADEGVKTAGEMRENVLTLSARAAEQSVNGFSRMLGLGQNPGDAMQQWLRSMEIAQASARFLGTGYRDISLEYMNWARNQMQTNVTSLARISAMPHAGPACRFIQPAGGREYRTRPDTEWPSCRDIEGSGGPDS